MGYFPCDNGSESEPEEVVVPRIHPQVGNPADAQAPLGRSDSEGNVQTTIPEQVEPFSTARGSLPPGVRIRRNANGGVQVYGDFPDPDSHITWDGGQLLGTGSGHHFVLGGDRRQTRRAPGRQRSGRNPESERRRDDGDTLGPNPVA
jgi:hypothetical protein